MFDEVVRVMLLKGIVETLYMTVFSTLLSYLFGMPLGVLLVTCAPGGLKPIAWLYKTLDLVINLVRSIPFLILLISVAPVTRAIVGTTLGSTATVVPLVIAAVPFIARLVETSLLEVDSGMVEAAWSMGCSPWQIITGVLLPEAKPSLITGSAIAIITILGYSAMAGIISGGGLGDIAIRYGYYRFNKENVMLVTVVLLVIIVQIFQEVGNRVSRSSDKRIGRRGVKAAKAKGELVSGRSGGMDQGRTV
jgi:D-methionine transport system permease protein